jgi:integrase
MANRILSLVSSSKTSASPSIESEDLTHHLKLLEGYLQSHRIRNHAARTLLKERSFLEGWFTSHGSDSRILYTWEAMRPIEGRERIAQYATALQKAGISPETLRSYLGMLSRYFSYVLEHPYIFQPPQDYRRIQDLFGPIEQPISEYDMPQHSHDGQRVGIPLDPEKLFSFYAHLRQHYVGTQASYSALESRNYTMVVLAGESGLRIDELLHLEISKDLFFESAKLQTRYGKGTQGSGKRVRVTLFTPLARDTVKFYLNTARPKIPNVQQTDLLFPSKQGKVLPRSATHKAMQKMIRISHTTHFPVASHMGWHWLRKLFATRFIERFPDQLPVLLSLLGHQNLYSIHRYIRHSEAWMDQKIQSVLKGIS